MAMLAEPKRKQKWSINPRGKNWSDDNSKFGQKMLEKMGWSKGKGLGPNGQGMIEHVRVKLKSNQSGIGFDQSKHNEKWTEHQESFNDLLQKLQNGENGVVDVVKDIGSSNLSGQSLEKKSQFSRARLHYKKFTRGKDVNKYSTKDLANIFGKKELEGTYAVKSEETTEEVRLDPIGSADTRGGVLTIKGGNMADYFNKKTSTVAVDFESPKRFRTESESESEIRTGFGFQQNDVAEEKNRNEENSSGDSGAKDGSDSQPEKLRKPKKSKLKKNDVNGDCSVETVENIEEKCHFAFENPCLLNVDQIDNEAKNSEKETEKLELEEIEIVKKAKKSKRSKKNKPVDKVSEELGVDEEICNFVFDNPSLLDNDKIDNETKEEKSEILDVDASKKKSKKNKRSKKSKPVDEVTENSSPKEESKEELGTFAFENPCLLDVDKIDGEAVEEKSDLHPAEVAKEPKKTKRKKKKKIDVITIESIENPADPKDDLAFDNPCLLEVKEIDEKPDDSPEPESKKVKNESKFFKSKVIVEYEEDEAESPNFAFENPCLLDVDVIDNEAKKENEAQDPSSSKSTEKSEKAKAKKEKTVTITLDCENEFPEIQVLEHVSTKGKEAQSSKKKKKKSAAGLDSKITEKLSKVKKMQFGKTNKENEDEKHENSCAFENPCLEDVEKIDSDARESRKRKSAEIEGSSKSKKSKKILDSGVDESHNGGEFEVTRKQLGLVNTGLDLTDEKPGKKRVTFNDKVEYNVDVKKKKNKGAKLDRYEVENAKMRTRGGRNKDKEQKESKVHTKRELQELFFKSPVLDFSGSNVNEFKGYGTK